MHNFLGDVCLESKKLRQCEELTVVIVRTGPQPVFSFRQLFDSSEPGSWYRTTGAFFWSLCFEITMSAMSRVPVWLMSPKAHLAGRGISWYPNRVTTRLGSRSAFLTTSTASSRILTRYRLFTYHSTNSSSSPISHVTPTPIFASFQSLFTLPSPLNPEKLRAQTTIFHTLSQDLAHLISI